MCLAALDELKARDRHPIFRIPRIAVLLLCYPKSHFITQHFVTPDRCSTISVHDRRRDCGVAILAGTYVENHVLASSRAASGDFDIDI